MTAVLDISLEEFGLNLVADDHGASGPARTRRSCFYPHSRWRRLPMTESCRTTIGRWREVAREMEVGFVDVYRAWMERVRAGTPLGSLIIAGAGPPQ